MYGIRCGDCQQTYIGKTERQMIRRLLEHGAPKEMELALINRILGEHDAERYLRRNGNTNTIEKTHPPMNDKHQHTNKRNEFVCDRAPTVGTHMTTNGSADDGDLTRTNLSTGFYSSPQSRRTTGFSNDGIDIALRRSARLKNKKRVNYLDKNNDKDDDEQQPEPKLETVVNNGDMISKENKESHATSAIEFVLCNIKTIIHITVEVF